MILRKWLPMFFLILLLLPVLPAMAQDSAIETEDEQPAINEEIDDFPRWSSNGSVGYTTTGMNVKSNSLVGDLNGAREGRWTNHFVKSGITYGDVTYPDGDPIRNANRYFGNYKFEGYLVRAKKPYLWGLLGAESDEFQGFWGRYTAEAGFGYSFFGVQKRTLKAEAGYSFVDTNWIEKQEIDDNEFHYWEPTHNALARLIAEFPVLSYMLFTEQVTYRHNLDDEDDYSVDSSTGLSFRLTDKLSFKTAFNITYTNTPGLIEKLDEYGNVVAIDEDNDPLTEAIPVLEPAERTSYALTNALVISFF